MTMSDPERGGGEEVATAPATYKFRELPKGVTLEDRAGGLVLTASTRGGWGPVVVFALLSLCVLAIFVGWLRVPVMTDQSFADRLVLLAMFVLCVASTGLFTLMASWGRTILRIEGTRGRVGTGFFGLDWTDRFDLREVNYVEESNSGNESGSSYYIVIDGPRQVRCGQLLSDEQRRFMVAVLRHHVAEVRRKRV